MLVDAALVVVGCGDLVQDLVFETIDPVVPSLAVNLPVPLDRAGLVVGVRGNTVRVGYIHE